MDVLYELRRCVYDTQTRQDHKIRENENQTIYVILRGSKIKYAQVNKTDSMEGLNIKQV